ncbi:MAG: hypothetical protein L0L86_12140 [Lactococcus lactis]|nr:hypothetical protein [Lactococcus lactis]
MNNLFEKVDTTKFTDIDFGIMNFIIDHFTTVSQLSIHELAERLYTSDATIVRFCQKAGFSGFNELKYTIKSQQLKHKQLTNFHNQIDIKINNSSFAHVKRY